MAIKTTGKMDARKRAREATARFIAQRRKREQQIESATADFFTCDDAVTAAQAALEQAQVKRLNALAAMGEFDLTTAEIAELCGVDAAEVRKARKHTPDTGADNTASADSVKPVEAAAADPSDTLTDSAEAPREPATAHR